MAKVIKNLCVAVGKYTTPDGVEKNRYKKVGNIMQSEDGGKFILLDKTFNPAGVNTKRDSVLLSAFDADLSKEVEQKKKPAAFEHQDPNDEIPF